MISSGYLPGDSFIHRLDPRVKTVLLLFTAVSFFFPVPPPVILWYLSLCAAAVVISLGIRELWVPIKTILPLLILVTILTPPFHPSGDPLFTLWGPVAVTTGGLRETLRLLVRFSGITLSFFLYFRTTSIDALILTMRWYRLPYSLSLVIAIAFRYIPYAASLYRSIADAHRLRRPSQSPTRRRLRDRMHQIFPTLVSVMIHAVKTIPSLAMALESRGFGRSEKRSSLYLLPSLTGKKTDLFFAALIFLLILLPLAL
ncbi:MAG: energy-coupling factor transporter transmembrane component T family protein [Spirochaetaceae bacterium]